MQVMAAGGHRVSLPSAGAAAPSSLAAHVRQRSDGGSGWEVRLLPALRAVNHMSAAVTFCLTSDGGAASSGSTQGSPAHPRSPQRWRREQHQAVEVGSGGGTDLHMPGKGTVLRLWLGGGGSGAAPGAGWSQAVTLPTHSRSRDPILMVLHSSPAATASATAAGLSALAAQPPLGSVLAQLLPPDPATGQASLHFWPPLLLHNHTPCALRLRLPAGVVPLLHQQLEAPQQPGEEVLLPPGGSRQLTAPLQGGAVGSLLALEPSPAGGAGSSGSGGGDVSMGAGLSLVVPPLVAESAEQQWFDGSSPKKLAGGKGQPALYIAPPGEASLLRLPLLLPGVEAGAAQGAAGPGTTAAVAQGGGESTVAPADCMLVTQQHSAELPCMQLLLLPTLTVRNCLPVPVLFQVRPAPVFSACLG